MKITDNLLIEYRARDVSERIESARKSDARYYFNKYRDKLVHRNCPVCNKNRTKQLESYADSFSVVQCEYCTLIYVNPVLTQEYLNEYYQESESVRLLTEFYLKRNANKKNVVSESRLANVTSIAKKLAKRTINILEIGCGDGSFLVSLKDRLANQGIDCKLFGVEPNNESASLAMSQGLTIFSSFVGTNNASPLIGIDTKFDLVLCFELIEHVIDPRKFLQQLHDDMSSDGLLLITTPNINGFENMLTGYNGYRQLAHAICPPAHLQGFSTISMAVLANQTDFAILSLSAKGRFDAYAFKEYSDKQVLSKNLEKNSCLNSLISKIDDRDGIEGLQQVVNLVNGSSTMEVLLRR